MRALLLAHVIFGVLAVALTSLWTAVFTYAGRYVVEELPNHVADAVFYGFILFAMASIVVVHFLVLARVLRALDGVAGGRAGRVAAVGVVPVIEAAVLVAVVVANMHIRF